MARKAAPEIDTNVEGEEKTVYEIGYLLLPTIAEDAVSTSVSAIASVLEKAGAAPLSSGDPEFIDLAYEMTVNTNGTNRSFGSAYFGWVKFELEPSQIDGVKAALAGMQDVLRFLLIKTTREDIPTWKEIKAARQEQKEEGEEGDGETVNEEELDKAIEELSV